GWIKGGKHSRGREHPRFGEGIEQRRFSRIGIAHQRHGFYRHRFAALALLRAHAADILKLLLYVAHAAINLAAIGFELSFAGTTSADSATQLGHLNSPP